MRSTPKSSFHINRLTIHYKNSPQTPQTPQTPHTQRN